MIVTGAKSITAALALALALGACISDAPSTPLATGSARPLDSASPHASRVSHVASTATPSRPPTPENACVVFDGERVGQVAWSPEGAWLVVATQHTTGTIIRVAAWPELSFVQLDVSRGNDLLAVTAGPDGAAFWLRDGFRADDGRSGIAHADPVHELAVIDLPSIEHVNDLRELQWTDAGLLSVVERSPNDVYGPKAVVQFDPDSGRASEILAEEMTIDGLLSSADGNTLIYRLNDGTERRQMLWRDGHQRELELDPDGSVMALSPDGRWVVYRADSDQAGGGAVYAADSADGQGGLIVEHLAYRAALSSTGVLAYGWDEDRLCITDVADELAMLDR